MTTNFADNLKKLRKLYGLKQGDFGKLFGITSAQVSAYERQISIPNIDLIKRIALYFNLSIAELEEMPIRPEFYNEAVVSQEEHPFAILFEKQKTDMFKGKGGYVFIDTETTLRTHGDWRFNSNPGINFFLLTPEHSKVIIPLFTQNFDKLPHQKYQDLLWPVPPPVPNECLNGYPLLLTLYRRFNKMPWLGSTESRPADCRNILALQLSDGKIIRLYITDISQGCQLYAVYNPELETHIKNWLALDQKHAKQIAKDVTMEINKYKFKYLIDIGE